MFNAPAICRWLQVLSLCGDMLRRDQR